MNVFFKFRFIFASKHLTFTIIKSRASSETEEFLSSPAVRESLRRYGHLVSQYISTLLSRCLWHYSTGAPAAGGRQRRGQDLSVAAVRRRLVRHIRETPANGCRRFQDQSDQVR